jgi:hypothetical protein
MAIKNGINFPLMVYNYLNNIEMEYQLSSDSVSEWMHYMTDIPYSLIGIATGRYSIGEIIKSYSKFPVPAVLDFTDILPSFAEIALLPLFLSKR